MNKFQDLMKKGFPYIVSVIILLLVNMVMFYPQLEGKTRPSSDRTTYVAKTHETKQFKKETGEKTYWNASMFSGMPEHLLKLGKDKNVLTKFSGLIKSYFSGPIGMFFQLALMCFIGLCLYGMNPWLALVASIFLSWNTNLLVLFSAGHVSKINVIAFFPLIICGALVCFRGEYLKGAAAIAFGTSFAIFYDHIQMVYYLIFAMLVIGIVYTIYNIKDKNINVFSKGVLVAVAAAALAGLSNFSQLNSANEFSQDTMRGNPILDKPANEKATTSSEVHGLEWGYAMAWSNGVKDVIATVIPRFVGGSSGERVSRNSEAGKLMQRIGAQRDKGQYVRTPAYWGELPFTGGPSYLGIPLVLLFVLSMFVVGPKLRWSMLGAVVLFLLLSMGKHASWLNQTLFDYFPLFNKFRAPNSILMSMPFLLVFPAFIGLQKIFKSEDKKQYLKPLYYSVGIVGGFSLLIMLLGASLFDYIKPSELQYDEPVQDILRKARISLQKSDSMRSLLFTLLTGGVLWTYISGKLKGKYLILAIVALLYIIDVVQVNKRYVINSDFVKKSRFESQFKPNKNDEYIFSRETKGKGYYRVFDLSVNTFADARPSYHHHQVGGYDPAKLQRYNDMIEQYISKVNPEVLNMLNTKYIITQEGQVSNNTRANGTAWFVKNILTANTPREEINAVGTIGTDSTAVVLKSEFSDQNIQPGNGSGSIELVEYQPNKMVYKSSSTSDQVAIFSEVWYGPNKGWNVTMDGQKTDHFRANYILRGMAVPAGEHEIVFEFKPKAKNGWLSMIASILILILTIGVIGKNLKSQFA